MNLFQIDLKTLISKLNFLNHNAPKWLDTLLKSCTIFFKIFKVCLAIWKDYVLKDYCINYTFHHNMDSFP